MLFVQYLGFPLEFACEPDCGCDAGNAAEPLLDCKASATTLAVPEDDGAVAHGDANLAIDDFLKSAFV